MQGIVLEGIRKKTEITLPKSKAKVWLWDDILAGEIMGGLQVDVMKQSVNTDTFSIIVSIIADWNFIDKDGNKVAINAENIKKLSLTDFNVLAEEVGKLTEKESLSKGEKKS